MYVPEGRSIPALGFVSASLMAIGAYLPGELAVLFVVGLLAAVLSLAGMVNETFRIERRRA